ncbi:hypothetical protein LTR95_002556 [Oleoguttula sp. CCFEE 5521]
MSIIWQVIEHATIGAQYGPSSRSDVAIIAYYYTVQTTIPCIDDYQKPSVITSPNKNDRGGGYYSVVGSCRAQEDQYWDLSGRAGGPQRALGTALSNAALSRYVLNRLASLDGLLGGLQDE